MKCPNCSQVVEHDFGMVTCPSCGSILFIDLEGKIHLNTNQMQSSTGNTNPAVQTTAESSHQNIESAQTNTNSFKVQKNTSSAQLSQQTNNQFSNERSLSAKTNPFDAAIQNENTLSQPKPEKTTKKDSAKTGVSSGQPKTILEKPVATAISEQNNFTGSSPEKKETFQKMLESMLEEKADLGIVTYDIWIQNINNKAQKELLIECLTDTRFNWSVPEMLKNFKNGVLFISNCPPVKAGVLIKRLLEYNLEVKWRQRAS